MSNRRAVELMTEVNALAAAGPPDSPDERLTVLKKMHALLIEATMEWLEFDD